MDLPVAVETGDGSLRYILYYAGPCPLCNRVVRWMSRHQSSRAVFVFRPLPETKDVWIHQGLPPLWWDAPDSVLIYDEQNGRWYRESDAVLLAMSALDSWYRWLVPVFKGFPPRLRDTLYLALRPKTSLRGNKSGVFGSQGGRL